MTRTVYNPSGLPVTWVVGKETDEEFCARLAEQQGDEDD